MKEYIIILYIMWLFIGFVINFHVKIVIESFELLLKLSDSVV